MIQSINMDVFWISSTVWLLYKLSALPIVRNHPFEDNQYQRKGWSQCHSLRPYLEDWTTEASERRLSPPNVESFRLAADAAVVFSKQYGVAVSIFFMTDC